MWKQCVVKPGNIQSASMSVTVAHPWVYGLGQQTESGAYLSPVNAVGWLAEKLSNLTDTADVVIFMVAGQSHDDFMANLDPLTSVFPAQAFSQVSRLARSAAELATVKMQIPSKPVNSLPDPVPLSVPTARTMSGAAAVASAAVPESMSLSGLKASLENFTAQRSELLADIAQAAAELGDKSASAWVFASSGGGTTMAGDLLENIPAVSSIYSAALMLVGSDLSNIREMIHDGDHTGA